MPTLESVAEHAISFTAEHVAKIFKREKTQTRRVINPQPPSNCAYLCGNPGNGWAWTDGSTKDYDYFPKDREGLNCPYGKPGDRLWVREACLMWKPGGDPGHNIVYADDPEYRALLKDAALIRKGKKDGSIPEHIGNWAYTSQRFMPRRAARLILELTDVRVQRVQDISEEDALAEGCSVSVVTADDLADLAISDVSPQVKELGKALGPGRFMARCEFMGLWDSINGQRGYLWLDNPWVWALSFKVVE
jgi:hypothetical protein